MDIILLQQLQPLPLFQRQQLGQPPANPRGLLEQFRELETGDECPESRGFFDKLKSAFGA